MEAAEETLNPELTTRPSPRIELLAPARDLACGIAAIDAGADAVYLGASRFGARAKAGNSLADIARLVDHAHLYWARVYVTVNTLLKNEELPDAVDLIQRLYALGVDALIIQDMGLLELDLPPIPLIASTQVHNDTPEKVAFLEQVGFRRAILARELTLDEIRAIRAAAPRIELETFVHGALCVSYSGQCYLSYAIGGRSGNRGECAQPCRRVYSLVDREGKVLVKNRHLLSLRDLNLSAAIPELLDAGVTSFKIEGRLKDQTYVTNVVSAYRQRIDAALGERGLHRSSSGTSTIGFTPDLSKTFNRGYTTYFLHGRDESPGSIETPKMVGEPIGRARRVRPRQITLERSAIELHNGDGLCWFDPAGGLQGSVVSAVEGSQVTLESTEGLRVGAPVYRNHDHEALAQVERATVERRIGMRFIVDEAPEGLTLTAVDEDNVSATVAFEAELQLAEKPELARATIDRQLRRTGDTLFTCQGVEIRWERDRFVPVAALNALRRAALEALTAAREAQRPVAQQAMQPNDAPYPAQRLSYLGNVLNERAAAFYRRHGVGEIEPAAESGLDLTGRQVMRARYCIRHQVGLCPERNGVADSGPLFLVDEEGHRFRLSFNCRACEMLVRG